MVTTRDISYEADGRTMIGMLAVPDGDGRRPGILVCHEGPGLDDHAKGRAERLAGELGAIGYCFGGTLSLELARGGADLKAAVGFHAGLGTTRPEDARAITGKVLALIGADDPIVPHEQRRAFEEEMTAGGVDWQLVVYGGAVHSFTNQRAANIDLPGIAYHEPTDRRSWQAMLDLFAEVFG